MICFSSQIGTKTAPGTLVPFGWTRADRHFRDDIAYFERCRAEIENRPFGRRRTPPAKQSVLRRKTLADRLNHFPPEPAQKTFLRHPRFLFTRSR
jgi:hypothetical protein